MGSCLCSGCSARCRVFDPRAYPSRGITTSCKEQAELLVWQRLSDSEPQASPRRTTQPHLRANPPLSVKHGCGTVQQNCKAVAVRASACPGFKVVCSESSFLRFNWSQLCNSVQSSG